MEERLEELDEANEDLKLDIKDAKMMISDLQTQIPVTTWQPKPKKPKTTGFPTDPEYDKSVKWLWRSAHGGDSCSFPVDTLTVLPCPDWLIRCGVGEHARGGPQKFAALRWSPQPFYTLIVLRVCRSLLPTDGEMQVPGIHREPFTTLLKLHLLP